MKKIIKITLLIIFIGVILFTFYYLYGKSKEKPVIYETTQAIKTDIVKKTVATGSVIPRKEIEIKPKVSGIIEEIYAIEGEHIKKGDLIAKIRIIPNMVNLNNAQSRVKRAEIALENAKVNYQRYRELLDQNVISESDFETYDLAYINAQEELQSARDNLSLIEKGQTNQSNKSSNTLVHSTIDGIVLDIPVEIGNSVIESNTFNDGTTIAIVADMGEMIFEGKIDESEVGKISEGMPLILTIGAIDNVQFNATLEHISPKGEEENGAIQFEIKAAVELIDNVFIRAGYSANADIVLDKVEKVLAINESLLQFRNDTIYVEVETEEQTFEERIIETGLSDGINIEVLSGLSEEDRIKKPM